VLLDNLGRARNLGTEGNHNTLHGLRGIIDHVKNNGKDTLNRSKSGGDRMKRRYGMDSHRNRQEKQGGTPNHLRVTLGHRWRKKERVQCGLKKKRSKGFIPRGPELSGEET
jgi:hypothetical protein